MRPPIVIDVAKAAGVSPSTVSNVLNSRRGRVSAQTRARVLAAVRRLRYAPNQVARQLRTGVVPIIGLIVPSVANPFWGLVAQCVEETAREHGYRVLLCNGQRDPKLERGYAEALYSSGVRGLILASSPLSVTHLASLRKRQVWIVTLDRHDTPADSIAADNVGVDNVEGARMAVAHLIERGHRRIGFVSGPLATVSRRERLEGYRIALEDAGIPFNRQLIWEARPREGFGDSEAAQLGWQGARSLLQLRNPPTACFCINDMYALGVCKAAHELGLEVPKDVSVVGFDDIPLAELTVPSLTTVRQPVPDLMRSAVARLIGRIHGRIAGEPVQVLIPATLIVRSSTARPPRILRYGGGWGRTPADLVPPDRLEREI